MRPSAHITCALLLAVAGTVSACRRELPPATAEAARRAAPVVDLRPAAGWSDADEDGIPDRAEMRAFIDRENFRRWFTAIAEMQFYTVSDAWNVAQRDCAGLVRFAWREALRPHDRLWFRKMGAAYEVFAPDVRAFDLRHGPLGEKLFRTTFGVFREADLRDGTFAEFADARALREFNCHFVSRDRRRAQAGDLLFFYQPWTKYPHHVMIFLGESQLAVDDDDGGAADWVVYHTGASSAGGAGLVKKVRLATLDEHPDGRWRPVAHNRNFLGFYRLRILQ